MVSENVEQLDQEAFFVSASPVMRKLRAQAELLAQADVPVFILGESGSGKDAVARLIHNLSVRSSFRFFKLSCAAIPANLLETELFGNHNVFGLESSLSNSVRSQFSEHGTIFLDEIAEMPTALQSRLLEALQDNDLRRRERENGIPAGMRILAATSSNLERALADKKLREDLYYRLSVFTLHVPPLRQRREEIALLLRYSMHKLAKHYGLTSREFSPAMLDACQCYSWPGNLKELENFVKRYLVSGDNALTPGGSEPEPARMNYEDSSGTRTAGVPASQSSEGESGEEKPSAQSLKSLIQGIKSEAERNAIGAALDKTGWNRKAAARLLKVSYRTLLYKIDQYQMTASMSSFSDPNLERFVLHRNGTKENGR